MSKLPGSDPTQSRVARIKLRRRGTWRFYGLTALGTLIPGAGLTAAGRRVIGGLLLLLSATAVALLAYVGVTYGFTTSVLNLAVRPSVLRNLSIGIAAAAVLWVASIVATAVVTKPLQPTGAQRVFTFLFAAAMCLVVAAPSAQLVRYLNIQRDVVKSVFGGKHKAPSFSGVPQATPEVTKDDPWANVPRVNVLLLGSDSGKNRIGVRPDSMIVASINTKTGDTVLFGVPRNLQNVPFPRHDPLHAIYPNGFNCGSACLMNAVWTLAESRRDLFPGDKNPGLTATRDALSAALGLTIDYTVIIDLSGFTSLVNAMGGVTIDVKERIPIGGEVTSSGQIVGITGWIEKGRQHMDGRTALWYSRSRATTDDFSRMRRQRCMVGALIEQVNPVSMLEKYPQLAAVAKRNVQVDISEHELPAWVELIRRIQDGKIRSLPFTTKNTDVTRPDFDAIRDQVQKAIRVRTSSAPTTSRPEPTATKTPRATSGPTRTEDPAVANDQLVELSRAC